MNNLIQKIKTYRCSFCGKETPALFYLDEQTARLDLNNQRGLCQDHHKAAKAEDDYQNNMAAQLLENGFTCAE